MPPNAFFKNEQPYPELFFIGVLDPIKAKVYVQRKFYGE